MFFSTLNFNYSLQLHQVHCTWSQSLSLTKFRYHIVSTCTYQCTLHSYGLWLMLFVSVPLPLIDQLYSLGELRNIAHRAILGSFWPRCFWVLFLLHTPELIQNQAFNYRMDHHLKRLRGKSGLLPHGLRSSRILNVLYHIKFF